MGCEGRRCAQKKTLYPSNMGAGDSARLAADRLPPMLPTGWEGGCIKEKLKDLGQRAGSPVPSRLSQLCVGSSGKVPLHGCGQVPTARFDGGERRDELHASRVHDDAPRTNLHRGLCGRRGGTLYSHLVRLPELVLDTAPLASTCGHDDDDAPLINHRK